MRNSTIVANIDKCVGCNKCIDVCPVKANIAMRVEDGNKIHVDTEKCILCGQCLATCDHQARDYTDDTKRFFADLRAGKKISVLTAPAIRINFPDTMAELFGYLRKCGVAGIYDVSFGADITTWAYLKAYEQGRQSMIAQPCPVVVEYIERFNNELIQYLAPVHSPAMCAAVYLREYERVGGDYAFLSPCIGKSNEFADTNTKGYISYNVTYSKLKQYLKEHNIDLRSYKPSDFDGTKCSLGLLYSRPGGLAENVRHACGDSVWIRQVEGTKQCSKYLEEYSSRAKAGKALPQLVDILNCEHGCNIGTGTANKMEIDDIDGILNTLKRERIAAQEKEPSEVFNETLDSSRFARSYTAKPVKVKAPDSRQLEQIFTLLGKNTEQERGFNCYSCGYGNCKEFASAVARGENHIDNCAQRLHKELLRGKESIVSACEEVRTSINLINSVNEQNVKQISDISQSSAQLAQATSELRGSLDIMAATAEDMKTSTHQLDDISRQTRLLAINALIEAAHAGQYGVTFGVVANEVRDLAQRSATVVEETRNKEETIYTDIGGTIGVFDSIDGMVGDISGSISGISQNISAADEKCKAVMAALDRLLEE